MSNPTLNHVLVLLQHAQHAAARGDWVGVARIAKDVQRAAEKAGKDGGK